MTKIYWGIARWFPRANTSEETALAYNARIPIAQTVIQHRLSGEKRMVCSTWTKAHSSWLVPSLTTLPHSWVLCILLAEEEGNLDVQGGLYRKKTVEPTFPRSKSHRILSGFPGIGKYLLVTRCRTEVCGVSEELLPWYANSPFKTSWWVRHYLSFRFLHEETWDSKQWPPSNI